MKGLNVIFFYLEILAPTTDGNVYRRIQGANPFIEYMCFALK